MKEKLMQLWSKFKTWKYANIALWGGAATVLVALSIVIALTVGSGNKPADPSISGTTPTGTTATKIGRAHV